MSTTRPWGDGCSRPWRCIGASRRAGRADAFTWILGMRRGGLRRGPALALGWGVVVR